jgi:hypothetical protein
LLIVSLSGLDLEVGIACFTIIAKFFHSVNREEDLKAVAFNTVGDVWINKGFSLRQSPPSFQRAAAVVSDAQVVFANLEGPLSMEGYPTEKLFNLRANPARIKDLLSLGINVVSLANNHIMDYGPDALLDTLELLDRHGVHHVGAGRELAAAWKPIHLESGGLRIAFLAFASTLPPGAAAGEGRPGVAPVRIFSALVMEPNPIMQEQPGTSPAMRTWSLDQDAAELQCQVETVKAEADFLILSAHWGVSGDEQPTSYQQTLAHLAVDAGADLIVGHHPHILQPVEIYRHKQIFYSLGNFIFEHLPPQTHAHLAWGIRMKPHSVYQRMSREAVILRVSLSHDGKVRSELLPLILDEEGHPWLVEGEEARKVLERIALLSEPYGVSLEIQNGRGLVQPA